MVDYSFCSKFIFFCFRESSKFMPHIKMKKIKILYQKSAFVSSKSSSYLEYFDWWLRNIWRVVTDELMNDEKKYEFHVVNDKWISFFLNNSLYLVWKFSSFFCLFNVHIWNPFWIEGFIAQEALSRHKKGLILMTKFNILHQLGWSHSKHKVICWAQTDFTFSPTVQLTAWAKADWIFSKIVAYETKKTTQYILEKMFILIALNFLRVQRTTCRVKIILR